MAEEPKVETKVVKEDSDFSLETLFLRGHVKKTYSITPKFSVTFKSLSAEEALEVRNDSEIETGTRAYGISMIGLTSVAASTLELNGQPFTGTLQEKKSKLKKLAAPVLDKIIEKHVSFHMDTEDLFPKDPADIVEQVEKK